MSEEEQPAKRKYTKRVKEPEAEAPKQDNSDLLDIPGIGPATMERLVDAGYDDLLTIAVASPGEIAEKAEIGVASAQKIIEAARKAAHVEGFRMANEILEERKNAKRIKIGVQTLDDLIGGGFETGQITEAYGEFGSGKTQIAHQLAVNVTTDAEHGGLDGETAWLDTEKMFRPERIKQMAVAKGLNGDDVLKKIFVAEAFNSPHQAILVDKVAEMAKTHPIRLIVVDSLTAHFRAEFAGRGELAPRQQKLNAHIHALSRLGSRIGAVIYVTNQVQSKPDQFFGDPTRPVGGHIVGHASAYRLYLRKTKPPKRIARLVDSPSLPEGEAVFSLTEAGVVD